jgi:hypothetical protein
MKIEPPETFPRTYSGTGKGVATAVVEAAGLDDGEGGGRGVVDAAELDIGEGGETAVVSGHCGWRLSTGRWKR